MIMMMMMLVLTNNGHDRNYDDCVQGKEDGDDEIISVMTRTKFTDRASFSI